MATIDWMASDRYKRRHVPAGTTLCHEGDFGDTMYFVVQGSLQISKRVIQGADKVIATLGDGQYDGELSLLTGAQRNATIRAVEGRRMRFIATGSFPGEKTAEVLRLAAEQALLANSPALVTSLIRPGRNQEALVYVLETDDPSDLLELITPFMGLVQWDISPALELDVALAATVQTADKATPP